MKTTSDIRSYHDGAGLLVTVVVTATVAAGNVPPVGEALGDIIRDIVVDGHSVYTVTRSFEEVTA